MKLFPVVEAFSSIQGEGPFCGYPAFFVRVKHCQLYKKCPVGCDTYDRIQQLSVTYIPYEDIVRKLHHIPHLIITGGEPTLYIDDVSNLISYISEQNISNLVIEIETNGYKLPELINNISNINTYVHISYSPKTYNPDEIINFVKNSFLNISNRTFCIKIVTWDDPSVVSCIEQLAQHKEICDYIWLMPRGAIPAELEKSWPIVLKLSLKYNLKVTSRLHIYSNTL